MSIEPGGPVCLTKMFDLLLIFLHKGFMFLFLLFFSVLSKISFDINNALQRSDSGRNGNYYRIC